MKGIKQGNFFSGWGKARRYYYDKPNGYAAQPGGGASDKTCKTCRFRVRVRPSNSTKKKLYNKCQKRHPRDDFQPIILDDIQLKSPACEFYESIKNEN